MRAVNRGPWPHWPLPRLVTALTMAATLASLGVELSGLREVFAEQRQYQTREIQEGLSALHRDLQMLNHLVGGPEGVRNEAEAREYASARREQLSMVRWLAVLPNSVERPHVLLASAEMRSYDPRRDPTVATLVFRAEEGSIEATVPGSHRDKATLAIVLGPTEPGHTALVALVDGDDLLDDSLSALTSTLNCLTLLLNGHAVGHWPHIFHRHSDNISDSEPVSVAALEFSLDFGILNWPAIIWPTIRQPMLVLITGMLLALLVRNRQRQLAVALRPETAPIVASGAAASAGDIQRGRLWQLGELAATMSHDLGQPLNVIRLSAEAAQDAAADGRLAPERLERTLSNITAQTLRAQAMIDALVAATRHSSLPPTPLQPVEAVRQALAEVMPQIKAQNVRLSWHADLATPPVLGHAPRLTTAVRHLLVNALEAMASRPREGTDGGTLSVECRPGGAGIAIVVTDDGPGFPPALLPLLDDPLAAPPERGKGCGLGLTVVLGVAAEMGGTLSITEADPGTRATLALPRARRTVLLVDDDDDAIGELAEYLSDKGWLVRHSSGGNPALAAFLTNGADAVVTDLHMADGDGWQLIERLRALAPDLPIIAMSTADGEEARRAVTVGAAVVMRKPVGLREIYDEITSLTDDVW